MTKYVHYFLDLSQRMLAIESRVNETMARGDPMSDDLLACLRELDQMTKSLMENYEQNIRITPYEAVILTEMVENIERMVGVL